MTTMSEPTSDALSGVDGTQAPEPLADPSTGPGHGSWRDVPELPLIWLPPAMDDTALRKAIAAALGDDPGAAAETVDHDPAATPAPQAAPHATRQPRVPDVKVPDAHTPDAHTPDVNVPNVNVAVPPHTATSAGAPTGRPAPTEAADRSSPRRPSVSALIPPAPSQSRRSARLRYRPPMAGALRESAPLTDLRRRIRREHVDLPVPSRSDGGATAFFLVMLMIAGLLVYFIVTGFLDSLSSLLP